MFLELLSEVQEKVIGYCGIDVLKNLSTTCRECNTLVQPFLYSNVTIPYSEWKEQDFALCEDRLSRWEHTKKLKILWKCWMGFWQCELTIVL